MTHTIFICGYEAKPTQLQLGTVDSYGIETLQLKFSDGWAGLTVTASFTAPDKTTTDMLVGVDGLVDVPHEATCHGSGQGLIVLRGCRDGVQIISCSVSYFIKAHGPVNGTAAVDPTPDKWQQFVNTVAGDREAAQDAANRAGQTATAAEKFANKAAQSAQAAETDRKQAVESADNAADSADAAAKSAEAAKKSADDAKAVQDSLPADYTKLSGDVDVLNTKMELAYPDNTGVGDATWGAKQIIDTLCPPIEETGNPVQCYPPSLA